MRKSLFVFCPVFIAAMALYFTRKQSTNTTTAWVQAKRQAAISCAPLDDEIIFAANDKIIPIMPGWGKHSYAISTKVDSAQLYFNQGLTMYYSYHAREALAAFREAARFDSTNAMLYWAQALTVAPLTILAMRIK